MKPRVIIGLALSLACLGYLIFKMDMRALWELTLELNPLYIPALLALCAGSLLVRALRWKVLLAPIKKCSVYNLFSASLIGLSANNILPARLGEFARALALGRFEGVSSSSVLATLVLERILDGLTLLLCLFAALFFADPGARAGAFTVEHLRVAGLGMLALYAAVLGLMVCLWLWPRGTVGLLGRLARRLSQGLGEKVEAILTNFQQGLAVIGKTGRLAPLILLSLGVWLPTLGMFTLFLPAVGLPLSLLMGAMALAGASVGTAAPAGPGFIGTFQLAVTWSLVLAGAAEQQAMAYSVIFWAAANLPVTVWGVAEIWRRGLKGSLF